MNPGLKFLRSPLNICRKSQLICEQPSKDRHNSNYSLEKTKLNCNRAIKLLTNHLIIRS